MDLEVLDFMAEIWHVLVGERLICGGSAGSGTRLR
jgi:hypothetical protein